MARKFLKGVDGPGTCLATRIRTQVRTVKENEGIWTSRVYFPPFASVGKRIR